jgi:hypothetical protein
VCFLPEACAPRRAVGRFGVCCAIALALSAALHVEAQQIGVTLDDLEAPGIALKSLRATLEGADRRELTLDIGAVTIRDRTWRNVRVRCRDLRLERTLIACADGAVVAGERFPLSFTYSTQAKALDLVLRPAPAETWRLLARFARSRTEVEVTVENGRAARVEPWLPASVRAIGGIFDGTIRWTAAGSMSAQLALSGLSFQDAGARYGGEKIAGKISLAVEPAGTQRRWRATVDWAAGELSLQTIRTRGGGQALTLEGTATDEGLEITGGLFRAPGAADVSLDGVWDWRARSLNLALRSAPAETWRLRARLGEPATEFDVEIENGKIARLGPWLPSTVPSPTDGTFTGSIVWSGSRSAATRLEVEGLAFSDRGGLRAGEKIKAGISFDAREVAARWQWRTRVEWRAGEIFWQPLYLQGAGHTLSADGVLDAGRVEVSRGRLVHPDVGEVDFSAEWDRPTMMLASVTARSGRLKADSLYTQVLKPFLAGTILGDLRMDGGVEIDVGLDEGRPAALALALHDFSMEDRDRRFGLFGVNGRVPWHRRDATRAELAIAGGEVLRLPFGPVKLPFEMRGLRFAFDALEVPLLDGTLTVNDFRAASGTSGWRWRFSGGVAPISMERITQSVGLPTMHGTLSAVIPEVRYSRSTLTVDGALIFRVFDGTVVAKNVQLIEAFGRAPRLAADLDARGLDLDLLTRTFAFGSITGRIDAEVSGLELENWQPVRFDARVASSPGAYPRTISQRAVENISALGGAGAGTAIQRTFLRFFDQFRYERLGWSCVLRNNVCEMGGIEDAPLGYVIVKGGGIPAISVIGYNRRVDWQELLARVRRITQENVTAVVR